MMVALAGREDLLVMAEEFLAVAASEEEDKAVQAGAEVLEAVGGVADELFQGGG
jgi:hypothetical protein